MHINYPSRRAITLAETVISTLLIGFVLVSTLQIVGPMARSNTVHADRLIAANLANELSEEIATKLFIDPNADSQDDIGIDADDTITNRRSFDDIDDYNAWTSSPPSISSGSSIINLSGWSRSVTVVHAQLADPSQNSPTYTGLKRITVTVTKDGTQLAQITTLHSQTADDLGFIVTTGS